MCGHDGHCAWLVGGTSKILEKIDTIPSDKCVRLMFQPAEEMLGGAFPMIQEGCLDGIDEVYGAHNEPCIPTGKLNVVAGPTAAEITEIDIIVLSSKRTKKSLIVLF
jgi:metal-dependent amidase/aminoacylase/carboxypeptidase family protein